MLKFNASEVVAAFEKAKNINSATKKFLKNDVGNDHKSEKFIKSLKVVLSGNNTENKESFVAKHLPEYETHLMVLSHYAFLEPIDKITEQVVVGHADAFNKTYDKAAKGIEIKDSAKFKEIVSKVVLLIQAGFKEADIPNSNFMKNVMLFSIFEKDVLEEVVPLVASS